MSGGFTYVVRTNLPPEAVTRIGLAIFALWTDFALGRKSINGKRLVYPTGRYASSIQFSQTGESTVAIVADESVAPEAGILESGHRSFDMKTVASLSGRAIPMHRHVGATPGTSLRRIGAGGLGKTSMRPSMWAEMRSGEGSGFASFGPNSSPDSWIVPPMPAYAPAWALSTMAERLARA